MGETMGRSTNQVTPDFLVDSNDDGTVTFALNHGNLPELRVSAQYEEMARAYKDNKASMMALAKASSESGLCLSS